MPPTEQLTHVDPPDRRRGRRRPGYGGPDAADRGDALDALDAVDALDALDA